MTWAARTRQNRTFRLLFWPLQEKTDEIHLKHKKVKGAFWELWSLWSRVDFTREGRFGLQSGAGLFAVLHGVEYRVIIRERQVANILLDRDSGEQAQGEGHGVEAFFTQGEGGVPQADREQGQGQSQ